MRIVSIVGARPEFVQAAVLSRALRERHHEILVHTGQHYDDLMSDVFFRDLGLPEPDVNLGIGSSTLWGTVGSLLARLGDELQRIDPDLVVVRGDTSSTIAGALAARQTNYPLAHIEAGMRSFDLTMPE
ncbi:MAG: UDP-N-acetylglucosamine 2-epimerase, partial [Vulcanimicrobiaceae bacterium]